MAGVAAGHGRVVYIVVSEVSARSLDHRAPATRSQLRRAGGFALRTLGPRGQLAERALLEPADAFRAHAEPIGDLAQRLLFAVEPIAGPDDRSLALRQPGQQREQLLFLDCVEDALILA